MDEPGGGRPRAGCDAADDAEDDAEDPRVSAVLAVLSGEPADVVAARCSVAPAVLDRWVRAFVEAGSAQVTHHPAGEIARQRDRFLSTFMHDLRTPLAMAQVWVGLLGSSPSEATAVEVGRHLQAALDQLDERATDVELLTAAMLGRLTPDARAVSVASLAGALRPAPGGVAGEGGDVTLVVDPGLFARLLRDLWRAAHGLGSPPSAVRLEVETVPPWVEVRIVREGAPVEARVLHALLEPFDRVDDDARVTVGLSLARALVDVHGGSVVVEQDDRRTTLAVRVPDRRPAPEEHR